MTQLQQGLVHRTDLHDPTRAKPCHDDTTIFMRPIRLPLVDGMVFATSSTGNGPMPSGSHTSVARIGPSLVGTSCNTLAFI